MALNIDQANIGYDTVGIQEFINSLNLEVITELTQEMDAQIPKIREVVDQVWVGQSANAFKEKLERDTSIMKQTLETLKEDVEGQFAQIAKNIDNYDSAIAETISSQTE